MSTTQEDSVTSTTTTKVQKVQHLIDTLSHDIKEHNLSPSDTSGHSSTETKIYALHKLRGPSQLVSPERFTKLQELKVHGRDVNQSDPIYTPEGIKTLAQHGFDNEASDASREALRCLANALMLAPQTRQIFLDLGYADKAAINFSSGNIDDEFLLGRILFLLTYGTTLDISKLLEKDGLAKHMNQAIARHATKYRGSNKAPASTAMDDMALSETLKLLFNTTHLVRANADLFTSSVPSLLTIFSSCPLLEPPIQPPISQLINVFINLDLSKSADAFFPSSSPNIHLTKFLTILDGSLKLEYFASDSLHDFDASLPPLLTLLIEIYEMSPDGIKNYMKSKLLCAPEERDLPLGRTSTLAARCLKLTIFTTLSQSRELIFTLLFSLSDQNVHKFIHNVGYGFASGYLVSHQIPIPPDAIKGNKQQISGMPVNPITGQSLESERKAFEEIEKELAQMTDEEKMREAERLFVLFERLKETGVVDVKNPVQVAAEEGRLQELPDADDVD